LANWGWGTLLDLLKAGAGAAMTAAGMPQVGVPLAASGVEGVVGSATAPSDDEIRAANEEQARAAMRKPYQRSSFMPEPGQGPMARYAPQNRQMQSGVDPDVMQFLMKYMRPR